MENKENKKKRIYIRVSDKEYQQIFSLFKNTTNRKLSEYCRHVLLRKPVVMISRNRSQDDLLAELIRLRKELNAAGNNFNQAVRKLNAMDDSQEIRRWLTVYEHSRTELQGSILLIESHLSKLADLWLR